MIQIGGPAAPGMFAFDDVAAMGGAGERARLAELADRLQFDDPINIQFTSGTTGSPKGATLTHHNILNNGFFLGQAMRYSERDKVCIPVPLYHCFGMVIGSLACMTHGAAMVYPGEGFEPLTTLQTIAEERCTSLYGVPTMFIAELQHPDFDEFDLTQPAHRDDGRRAVSDRNHAPVHRQDAPDRNDDRLWHDRNQPGQLSRPRSATRSSGRPARSDASTRMSRRRSSTPRAASCRAAPPASCARAAMSVMLGYWDDPERTAEAIDPARWMHTGDLATIDDEGYCKIVGRIKDMVIRGGENVYPREIEEFLYRHPKIQDVQVFGVPDERYGEEICAWIKLRAGETMEGDEVRAFCDGQIAHYKIPRHVRFVDEFPLTVTGKVQKFIMRERMIAELGVREQVTA